MIDVLLATTPDKSSIAAMTKKFVDPVRITHCLERASKFVTGAKVISARHVSLPLSHDPFSFAVCGELQLGDEGQADAAALVLAHELRRAGFAVR